MDEVDSETQMSRRERLKQEREERILEAAAAVFARKGFHGATIREIAELADVADGTIYNYFADKRDLLVAITRHVIAESTGDAFAEFQYQDDQAFLKSFLLDRFDFAWRNSDFAQTLLSQVWTDRVVRHKYLGEVIVPLLRLMEGYLESRIRAGTLRPVNTGIVVQAIAGSFLIFVMLATEGEQGLFDGLSNEELADELADLFLFGLKPRLREERGAEL